MNRADRAAHLQASLLTAVSSYGGSRFNQGAAVANANVTEQRQYERDADRQFGEIIRLTRALHQLAVTP